MEPIFVRKLNRRERDFLYELMEDKRVGYRAKIIILSYEGYTPPQIEKALHMHVKNVRKWIHRFNEYGVKGIVKRKGGGRKPKIDEKVVKRIVNTTRISPHKLGLPFSTWSLRKLETYLHSQGIEISYERIRQLLLKHGFKFWKTKQELISRDPEFEAKKARILRLYRRANCVVLCMDEKRVAIKYYGGRAWRVKKKIIPLNQRVKEALVLFGVYDPHNKWRCFDFYPNMRTESFIDFVHKVVRRFKERVYLILDNHPANLSKKIKQELAKIKNLKLVYLPFNYPKLNRIEDEFSLFQKEVLANRNFKDSQELVLATKKWVRYRNRIGIE